MHFYNWQLPKISIKVSTYNAPINSPLTHSTNLAGYNQPKQREHVVHAVHVTLHLVYISINTMNTVYSIIITINYWIIVQTQTQRYCHLRRYLSSCLQWLPTPMPPQPTDPNSTAKWPQSHHELNATVSKSTLFLLWIYITQTNDFPFYFGSGIYTNLFLYVRCSAYSYRWRCVGVFNFK